MRLNPVKCTFNLLSGKFLGFLISQGGIEANLEEKNTSYIKHVPHPPIGEAQGSSKSNWLCGSIEEICFKVG